MRMLKTVAALFLLSTGFAFAQSVPTWLFQGSVPTAAQWQSGFAGKNDTLGFTPVNKSGDSMLGLLRIAPATSGTTGLSVQQGTAPSSPNNGDMWMTTAGLFYRANGVTYGPITGAISCSSMPALAGAISSTAGTCTTAFSATVPIANGGTGQTSAAAALTALGGAPLASPTFTGTPLAPTPGTSDNSTKIATTAFVKAQGYVTSASFPVTSVFTRTGAITAQSGDYSFSLISGTATVAQGGTGSGTAGGARTNLAVPGLATANVFTANNTLQNNLLCFQLDCSSGSGVAGIEQFDGTSEFQFRYVNGGVSHLASISADSATLNNALSIANGGTGNTSASAALAALGGAPTASPTFTGTITGAAETLSGVLKLTSTSTPLRIDAAAGTVRSQGFYTSGSLRWLLYADSGAESGGNAGSGFRLSNYDDTGTIIGTPMIFNRATGALTLSPALAIASGGTGQTSASAALTALGGAPLASPALTGTPTAPTASGGTNTTQLATTAFVQAAVSGGGVVSSVFGRSGAVVAATNDYNFNQLAGTAAISQGGTGGGSASAARSNLAVPGLATSNTYSLNQIFGGNIICFGFDCATPGAGNTAGVMSFDGFDTFTLQYKSGAVHTAKLSMDALTLATALTDGNIASAATWNAKIGPTSGSAIQKANGSGGLTAATSGTDYAPATSGSSILKASAGGFANAVSGTDYAPATTGSAILKASSGGFASAVANTDYLAVANPAFTGIATGPEIDLSGAFVSANFGNTHGVTQPFISTGTTGHYRSMLFLNSNLPVWESGVDNTTQSSTRTGDNFELCEYLNSGVFIDCPMMIARATGVANFADGLQSGGNNVLTSVSSISLTSQVTGILPGANGGTGNGFFAASGPTSSLKTFTFPNASATVLTDNAAVTVAQGGIGVGTLALNGILYGNGTSSVQALAVNSTATKKYLQQLSSGAPTWQQVAFADISGTIDFTTQVTGILPGANGGTGNGFTAFSGPTTSLKTFTLPNANATILTDNAAVTVAQGGTGGTTAGSARSNLAVPGLATTNEFTQNQTFDTLLCFSSCTVTGGQISYNTGTWQYNLSASTGGVAHPSELDVGSVVTSSPIAISSGGTGASSASSALTSLGALGSANNLSDVANPITSRTNLGMTSEYLATQFDKTNTTPTGVTGMGITTISAGAYHFREVLFLGLDATAGFRTRMGGTLTPTSIAYTISGTCDTTGSSLGFSVGRLSDITTAINYTGGCTSAHVTMDGVVQVTTGGTFIPQFALGTGSGPTSSVQVNSYAEYTKLN